MNDWIDATQRLPERSGEYIVNAATIGVTVATYTPNFPERVWWACDGEPLPGAVTHWMPMPVGPHPMIAKHPERLPAGDPWSVVKTSHGYRLEHVDAETYGPDDSKMAHVHADRLNARDRLADAAGTLRSALAALRSRMDRRMGDTDPSDPDNPDLLAMQAAAAALDGTPPTADTVAAVGCHGWTDQPPTDQGTYWHWTGDPAAAPLPMFVGLSGMSGKTFVRMDQLGLTRAFDCDEFGGWWKPLPDPLIPREVADAAWAKGSTYRD